MRFYHSHTQKHSSNFFPQSRRVYISNQNHPQLPSTFTLFNAKTNHTMPSSPDTQRPTTTQVASSQPTGPSVGSSEEEATFRAFVSRPIPMIYFLEYADEPDDPTELSKGSSAQNQANGSRSRKNSLKVNLSFRRAIPLSDFSVLMGGKTRASSTRLLSCLIASSQLSLLWSILYIMYIKLFVSNWNIGMRFLDLKG